jgi:hypothetical protein
VVNCNVKAPARWDNNLKLDTCCDHQEKYITEAQDPIVKFCRYKEYKQAAIKEFYSLLRAAMIGARRTCLLHRLVNDHTLPGIMARMPAGDRKQWAKERPQWIHVKTE